MYEKTMHIACNIDSKYTRFCGVLMVSIFENNREEHIKMHILGYHLSESDKNDLIDIANRYGNEIKLYDVDESVFKGFPISTQWPIVIYFRLMLPELISEETNRVLYLDCDIICRGELKELYYEDMTDCILAAKEDVLSSFPGLFNRLGYSPKYKYFNSGVILFNLEEWRKYDMTRKCIEYIQYHHVIHPDQDALNVVAHTNWKNIDTRWNFLSNFHTRYIDEEEFKSDLKCDKEYYPVLVHFTGAKPWTSKCDSYFKYDWLKYQSKTKWSDFIPKHSIPERLKYSLSLLLDFIGIKKRNIYKTF